MANIRIDALCREFKASEGYPTELSEKVRQICNGAFPGNPDIFTQEEAKRVDQRNPNLFLTTNGSFRFAEIMEQTPRYRDLRGSEEADLWKAFQTGVVQVSPGEPPFYVNGHRIEIIRQSPTVFTLRWNREVDVDFFWSGEKLSARVVVGGVTVEKNVTNLMVFIADELNKIAQRKGGRAWTNYQEVKKAVLSLPFMEPYVTGLAEHPSRFNEASRNHPKTFATYDLGAFVYVNDEERRLFADGFGRLFVEIGRDRQYIDSARYQPRSMFSWKQNEKVFQARLVSNVDQVGWMGCFSGSTSLQARDGSKLNAATLFQKYQRGESLPSLAVLNPESGKVVYQEPWRVTKRFVDPDLQQGIQLVSYADANGRPVSKPLELTPNHFVWAMREGREYWIRAQEIGSGMKLLLLRDGKKVWGEVTGNSLVQTDQEITVWKSQHQSLQGPSFSFAEIAKRPANGALDVYDIAFAPTEGQVHALAIASDEKDWVVAHNGIK